LCEDKGANVSKSFQLGQPRFFPAMKVQSRVVGAMVMRELQTRYGRNNVGYLWMIGEPLMLASVISTLHYVGKLSHQAGMGPYPFSVIGYCLFMIFRNLFNRGEGMIQSAVSMMYHKMITPLDVVLAKAIVELGGCLSSLAILMIAGIMLGIAELPVRPLYLFFAIFQIIWWAFGLSLIIASYTYDSHVLGRFVHPVSYFMMPLSGAFFTMSFLPPWARPLMEWNPMMSIFETARYGWFQAASDRYMFTGYTVAVSAGLTYWGLLAIRRVRAKIHLS
jgi:capsular polysaccharide transport system permease protein